MRIKSFQGGYDKNLCYVIWCKKTNLAGVIDPSVYPSEIFEFIQKKKLKIDKILVTHTHHDHIKYLDKICEEYPKADIYISNKTSFNKKEFIGVEDNDMIEIGENRIHTLFTPGHYKDSLCYWCRDEKAIFTGDTVFVGRTGRTISTGSSINKLYYSIYNIILKLPLETKIYPGHNYGNTKTVTIKENIKSSSFFSCRSFDEFVSVMDKFEKNRQIG